MDKVDIEKIRVELTGYCERLGSDQAVSDMLESLTLGYPLGRSAISRIKKGSGKPNTIAMATALLRIADEQGLLKDAPPKKRGPKPAQ